MTPTLQNNAPRVARRWPSLGEAHVPAPLAPSPRSFGLAVGGVLAAIAAISAWQGYAVRAELLGALGVILVVAALIRSSSLEGLASMWARVGQALGWFNSRVLLTLIFFLVLCPMGLVARLCGNDPLDRRRRGSRWYEYPARLRDSKHYEHLF